MINKSLICISGLPRSGSTLLCQLLGIHSEIFSSGHSSPLCQTVVQLRQMLSENQFLLSQLDCDFEIGYKRLLNAYRGFLNGWFEETSKQIVVDKNRGWLSQIETLNTLVPDFKMLVCIREPTQIYGSIETQHQDTILLDFPDHLANLSRHARADKLFNSEGVIGGPIKSIADLQDISESLQKHLYYVVFEHLVSEPEKVIADIHNWLGVKNEKFNLQNLPVKSHESDSYYRFKYSHATRSNISPPAKHVIPTRIEKDIRSNFEDFYRLFYPNS